MIAVFKSEVGTESAGILRSAFDARTANSHDFEQDAVDFSVLSSANTLTFDELGIAIVGGGAANAAWETAGLGDEDMATSSDQPYVLVP